MGVPSWLRKCQRERAPLYLALRVAGYHEFAQSRTPVPFIADDIMETFDDFRAVEAFRLFAEMANVGEVIYLTHYQHLCESPGGFAPMRAYTSWPCRSCRNAELREASHPRAVPTRPAGPATRTRQPGSAPKGPRPSYELHPS
jgi:hypothetical protein